MSFIKGKSALDKGKPIFKVDSFCACQNTVLDLVFLDDPRYICAGSADQCVHFIDVSKCLTVNSLSGHSSSVKSLCSCGSTIISGGRDAKIIGWDQREKKSCFVTDLKNQATITSIASPNDQMFISSDSRGKIILWDIRNPSRKFFSVPKVDGSGVSHITVSPDRKLLASISTNNVITLHKLDGTWAYLNREYPNVNNFYNRCSFSPCSKYIAVGSSSGTIAVFSTKYAMKPSLLHGHSGATNCVEWCRDNFDFILSCSDDKTVQLWSSEYKDTNQDEEEEIEEKLQIPIPKAKSVEQSYTLYKYVK